MIVLGTNILVYTYREDSECPYFSAIHLWLKND
jgi:hypothetical protein